MASSFDQVAKDARTLTRSEKAILARLLLEDLDEDPVAPPVEEIEGAWLQEARRRFEAYKSDQLQAIPADEAIRAARLAIRG